MMQPDTDRLIRLTPRIIIFLVIIFAIGFGLRMAYLSELMSLKFFPVLENSDSSAYYNWGKDVAAGDYFGYLSFMKWPLYAYCLGAWFKAFGTNLALIFFVQFILGCLNCILVFFIARKFFNNFISGLAAILCLLYGLFIFYDGLVMYTSLSLVLNSLFLLYLFKISGNPSGRRVFICGIFLGICAITQASIVLFGIPAVGLILFQAKKKTFPVVRKIVIFLCGFFMIIAVTALRNYISEKDFVPIAGNLGINFYAGNNPQSTGVFFLPDDITPNQEDMFRDSRIIAQAVTGRNLKTSEVSSFWMHKSLDYARNEPFEFMSKFIKKFLMVLGPKEHVHDIEYALVLPESAVLKVLFKDLTYILPFVFIGLFIGLKDFKKNFLLYLYIGSFSLGIAIFFVSARYRLMLIPVFMIFAAAAIEKFVYYIRARNWRGFKILCLIWIGVFIITSYGRIFAFSVKQDANLAAFEARMSNALVLENNSDYSAAMAELEKAYLLKPYNRRVFLRQGLINYKLGKFNEAIQYYRKAAKFSPLCADAYYNLGLIYNQQLRFAEAREVLLKAVSLDPYDFNSHFELGMAYAALNQRQEARDQFNLALKYINRWRKLDIEIIRRELSAL